MRKVVFLVPVISAALLLGAAALASADTLDQQQTASDFAQGVGATETLAQTFTAGISGGLDRVDLLLGKAVSPIAPVIVEIRDGSSAGPGPAVLATGVIPSASIVNVEPNAAFVTALFASPPQVTAGTSYAIVAFSSASPDNYGWHLKSSGNVYPGGASFYTFDSPPKSSSTWTNNSGTGTGADQAFKTYVVPPPAPTPTTPPAPSNTGERAAALASCKKRAHRHDWSHKRLKKCKGNANLLPV